jgi:hypothetical protein
MSAEWGQDEAAETPPAPPEDAASSDDTWADRSPDTAAAEEATEADTSGVGGGEVDDSWADESAETIADDPNVTQEPEAAAEDTATAAEITGGPADVQFGDTWAEEWAPEGAANDGAETIEAISEEPEDAAEGPEDAAKEPEDAAEEPEDAAEEPEDAAEEPEDAAEEPEDAAEEPEVPAEIPESGAEDSDDRAELPETGEAETLDPDDTWGHEPPHAAADNDDTTDVAVEEPDDDTEEPGAVAAYDGDHDDTWADEPAIASLDEAADRKMAEDIAALRAEQQILRDQGNLQAIADIDAFIDRLPVDDALKSVPSPPEDALDRRMAQDIISLRAEQDILRDQGNLEAVREIDTFIGNLPVDDRIRADPQGYLDGQFDEASQREAGMEILRQHFDNLGNEVFEMGKETASGRAYFESTDPLDRFSERLAAADGVYMLALHGSSDATYVSGVPVTAREVGDMIRADPKFAGAEVVHLHSCQTGAGQDCFAQQLANELGIPVEAPTNYAWLGPNGDAWVSGLEWVRQPDGSDAAQPMAATAADRWETFSPQTSDRDSEAERRVGPANPVIESRDEPAAAASGRFANLMLGVAFGAKLAGGIPDAQPPPDFRAEPPAVVQPADGTQLSAATPGQQPESHPIDEAPQGSPHPERREGGDAEPDDDDPNDAAAQAREAVEGALRGSRVRRSPAFSPRLPKPAPRDNRPTPYRRGKGPR